MRAARRKAAKLRGGARAGPKPSPEEQGGPEHGLAEQCDCPPLSAAAICCLPAAIIFAL